MCGGQNASEQSHMLPRSSPSQGWSSARRDVPNIVHWLINDVKVTYLSLCRRIDFARILSACFSYPLLLVVGDSRSNLPRVYILMISKRFQKKATLV